MSDHHDISKAQAGFIHRILRDIRAGVVREPLALISQGELLWPCSHRLQLLFPEDRINLHCKDPALIERIIEDEAFAELHYTADFYWSKNEIVVGEKAVVAGIASSAANLLERAVDLIEIHGFLRMHWATIRLPVKLTDWHHEVFEDHHFVVDDIQMQAPHEIFEILVYQKLHEDDLPEDLLDEYQRIWRDFCSAVSVA